MCNLDIRIVGAITDENALDEIESIMNVFAYEQRMKAYTSLIHAQHPTNEVKIVDKKIGEKKKFILINHPHILVKGLY